MFEKMNLKRRYSSDIDNLVEDFYEPVLRESNLYLRSSGFFTSKILTNYLVGLKEFYLNGGRMKMIVSPRLNKEDIDVLENINDEDFDANISRVIENELLSLLESDDVKNTTLFFSLIKHGILELRFAVTKKPIGMYHEKTGIFFSSSSDKSIAISGSNNETESAILNNHESFYVYNSWNDESNYYRLETLDAFNKAWSNEMSNLRILNLDQAKYEGIFKEIDFSRHWRELYDEIEDLEIQEQHLDYSHQRRELDFTPYNYQLDAVEILLKRKKGILKFATGSGKTKTMIYFMERFKELHNKSFFIVVVPDKTLVNQWYEELIKYNDNVLKVYSETKNWAVQFRDMINIFKTGDTGDQFVITTIQSMFMNGKQGRFLKLLSTLNDYVLIVDECHHFKTERILSNLTYPEYRIGLSATPESSLENENSHKMINYFGGIASEYSLSDAIRDKKLVHYNYFPIEVELTNSERSRYNELTHKIIKLRNVLEKNYSKEIESKIERLQFMRSWIVYGATNKIKKLDELLESGIIKNEELLIYCGPSIENSTNDEVSLTQLEQVMKLMYDNNMNAYRYTSKEDESQRANALSLFNSRTISPLVAIKCLDEGVDIPAIRNAVIMASTNSTREFIQRRGRILRLNEGKEFANIYDFIVRDFDDLENWLNISETRRILEYVEDADNKEKVLAEQSRHINILKERENAG